MTFEPRHYQTDAADAMFEHIKDVPTGAPLTVLPPGTGKGYLNAECARRGVEDHDGRILCLVNRKTLVRQNYEKACELWSQGRELFGINSAGLNRRDFDSRVLFAGIQSVYRHADKLGAFNAVFTDECHGIQFEQEGMFNHLFRGLWKQNPKTRMGGFTATDYRLDKGLIWGPGDKYIFDKVVYRGDIKEMIARKWLCKPVNPVDPVEQINTDGLPIDWKGEFQNSALDQRFNNPNLIKRQVAEIIARGKDRKSWLVFCFNISHAEQVTAEMRRQGIKTALIHSQIDEDGDELLEEYKSGEYRCLVNVRMFTEGFDNDKIDLIAMLAPTLSPGLYYQMIGRGIRVLIGWKEDCLILDFAGNIGYHGPIDELTPETMESTKGGKAPVKQCPACGLFCHSRFKQCPYCETAFPPPKARATFLNPEKGEVLSGPRWFEVTDLHTARDGQKLIAHYYHKGGKATAKVGIQNAAWFVDHLGVKESEIPFDVDNFFNGGYQTQLRLPSEILVDQCRPDPILDYRFAG